MKRLTLLLWVACLSGVFVVACRTSQNSTEKGLGQFTGDRNRRHAAEPWVNWQWNNGTRDDTSEFPGLDPASRVSREVGVAGALLHFDKTRLDLVTNNLVDTNGAYGDKGHKPSAEERAKLKIPEKENPILWAALQDGPGCGTPDMSNPRYRARTLDGSCNDFYNPKMGAVGERFPRNVSIAAADEAYKNFGEGGSGPKGLASPNPREVSELLLKRQDPFQHAPAPFFNLWAGAWIQFMTHDWFSHAQNGDNDNQRTMKIPETNIPEDRRVGKDGTWTIASTLPDDGKFRPEAKGPRPSKTHRNMVSHWWDGSQIYGWDAQSQARVRDPRDRAKLRLDGQGLLPRTEIPGRTAQETAAFFDNWWVGLSLLHTTFSREHNRLVDMLRDPANKAIAKPPSGAAQWSDDELFDVARLCVSALIAKIHTIEWTPQLLFNQVGDKAMHANWNGLLGESRNPSKNSNAKVVKTAVNLAKESLAKLLEGVDAERRSKLVSLLGSAPGITHLDSQEHFGSPFGLPEDFTAVYRLHSLIPDYLEIYDADAASKGTFRALSAEELTSRLPAAHLAGPAGGREGFWWRPQNAEGGSNMLPVLDTLREKSYDVVRGVGIENLAMTFGLTPVGQLTLGNFPRFLTELEVPNVPGGKIDLAAMDLIRDRERGIPRYNKFREELLLKPLKSFDEFIDSELIHEIQTGKNRDFPERRLSAAEIEAKKAALMQQKDYIEKMKSIYKDINDVDLLVGMQAEFTRPHGYAISETQFQVFIMNASRRLFSDRFFNQAYNDKVYTRLGFDFVNQTTMVDVIKRQYPKLEKSLEGVENAFEMWNRERVGYNLAAKQRKDFLR